MDSPGITAPPPASVARISRNQRREFLHCAAAGLPVVVTDATAAWPAMRTWTWDFFRERYGHLTKEIAGRTFTLRETIDRIMESTPERPAPYPFNLNLERFFPDLLADVRPELPFGPIDRVNHPLLPRVLMRGTEVYEVFFGGRGAMFPYLHNDALCLHTQITQIRGSKEFLLYPPDQTPFMYPRPDNPKLSQLDITAPDLQRFPLFAQARPLVVNVREGESLFFPSGWWHTTRIHEPCLSVGRVQLNAGNWAPYASDVRAFWKPQSRFLAAGVHVYLKALGGLFWLQDRLAHHTPAG